MEWKVLSILVIVWKFCVTVVYGDPTLDNHLLNTTYRQASVVVCHPDQTFFCVNLTHYSPCVHIDLTNPNLNLEIGEHYCGDQRCCQVGAESPCTFNCHHTFLNLEYLRQSRNFYHIKKTKKKKVPITSEEIERLNKIISVKSFIIRQKDLEFSDEDYDYEDEVNKWKPSYRTFCPLKKKNLEIQSTTISTSTANVTAIINENLETTTEITTMSTTPTISTTIQITVPITTTITGNTATQSEITVSSTKPETAITTTKPTTTSTAETPTITSKPTTTSTTTTITKKTTTPTTTTTAKTTTTSSTPTTTTRKTITTSTTTTTKTTTTLATPTTTTRKTTTKTTTRKRTIEKITTTATIKKTRKIKKKKKKKKTKCFKHYGKVNDHLDCANYYLCLKIPGTDKFQKILRHCRQYYYFDASYQSCRRMELVSCYIYEAK